MFLHHSPPDWQEGGKATCEAASEPSGKQARPFMREGASLAHKLNRVTGKQAGHCHVTIFTQPLVTILTLPVPHYKLGLYIFRMNWEGEQFP